MRSTKMSALLLFSVIVLLAGLMAGCGGGGQSGEQGGQNSGASEKNGGKKNRPETKVALGSVQNVDAEARKIILKPSAEEQGEKPLKFKLRPKARVFQDGKEIEIEDVKKGQQAQIEYIAKDKLNAALSVEVFDVEEGGGETTG